MTGGLRIKDKYLVLMTFVGMGYFLAGVGGDISGVTLCSIIVDILVFI